MTIIINLENIDLEKAYLSDLLMDSRFQKKYGRIVEASVTNKIVPLIELNDLERVVETPQQKIVDINEALTKGAIETFNILKSLGGSATASDLIKERSKSKALIYTHLDEMRKYGIIEKKGKDLRKKFVITRNYLT